MWFEGNVMYSVCIYDLSVMGVSRVGFQKKKLDRALSSIQFFWDFWNFFNFAKPLSIYNMQQKKRICPYTVLQIDA